MMLENKITPDKDAIREDLEFMTRRWHELDVPCVFEIRAIAPDREKQPQSARFSPDWIDEAVEWAESLNNLGFNVYVTRNPIRQDVGRSATDEDVVAAFFVWADCDDTEASGNVYRFDGPRWTGAVTTGRKPHIRAHTYWELEDPCLNIKAWTELQKGIAAYFGSDDKVVNPSRIMRVGGTITYPAKNKRAKGYTSEVSTIRTTYEDDRDPVPFEQMHRLFGHVRPPEASTAPVSAYEGGLSIDTGPQPLDREREAIKALSGQNWNEAVFKLVGSYVSKGLSDAEIHALTDPLTIPPYTVQETRDEVQSIIDRTRRNPKFETVEPAQQMMQSALPEAAKAPEQPAQTAAEDDAPPEWPTPVGAINPLLLPRRRWVYGTAYIRNYVTVTASAGGIGKTSLAQVEGMAIATGRALLGEIVKEQTNVWIVNLEDPLEEMQLRLAAAMQHYGIPHAEIAGKLFMDAEDTLQMVLAAEGRDGLIQNDALLDYMVKRIKECDIGVIIIDPFVSTHLVNENSNASIQAVVAMFRKLARLTNAAVHLIHHVRKGNGEDATIDSVRGAGALIGAARAARVMNRVSEDEAMKLGVDEKEARGIMRVDDGKANLAPPAQKALYRRMIGVQLPNDEWVGVATEFKLPDLFEGITAKMARAVQDIVAGAEEEEKPLRANTQAKQWVGNAVGHVIGLDPEDGAQKKKLSSIIKTWIKSDVLRVEQVPDKRTGREVPCVIVGEWVRHDET